MKTNFIFDFDDTLTNSYDFNQQMFVDTFLPHSPDIDQLWLRNLHFTTRGKAMHLLFQEAIDHFDLKLNAVKLTEENELLHQEKFEQIKFFEGTQELLDSLKSKGKKVYICTNRQYGSLNKILEKNQLRQYFEKVVSCKDEGHEKPDPFCIHKIIEESGQPKENFMYLGDSRVDYDFAEAAGVDFVIVDHYINKKQLFKMLMEIFSDNSDKSK